MSTNARTAVQLSDLVAGAFDRAAQCHSDSRSVFYLAARAKEYILWCAGKESASSHVSRLLPLGDFRPLLALQAAGGQSGSSTSNEVDVSR